MIKFAGPIINVNKLFPQAQSKSKFVKISQENIMSQEEAIQILGQMKAVELLKGLALSDDPKSNEFMKKLDKATTDISNEMSKSDEKK